MEIARVFMNAAMALMLSVSQGGGKAFLDGLERLRRQLGLVLRAEADNHVVGFRAATRIHGLGFHGFLYARRVVVIAKASGAPAQKGFFSVMSGIGDIGGQAGVVVIFRLYADTLADHG